MQTVSIKQKIYTLGEEIGNCITHGVMAAFLLVSLPFVAISSYSDGSLLQAASVSIFMISLFLMFLASTLYHAMPQSTKTKAIFRILDHICIYLAIAGTYTPIALCVIGGWRGWLIVGIQWSMVLMGIFYKSIGKLRLPKLSTAIYLIMGWTIVMFFPAWYANAKTEQLWLILLGGLFYTVGVIFYSSKWKFAHMIWHIMIVAASLSHFVAIIWFLN